MTIEEVTSFVNGTNSRKVHDIVNHFCPTPVVDPSEFTPPANPDGSDYLTTLQELLSVLSNNNISTVDDGSTIGLTDITAFNSQISRKVQI